MLNIYTFPLSCEHLYINPLLADNTIQYDAICMLYRINISSIFSRNSEFLDNLEQLIHVIEQIT